MAPRFNEPLFVISVAARLVEMHPQTLRKYEREGLVAPSRTTGNLRLYSDRDIERLRQVKYLVEERGLNLAGVQIALEMTESILATQKLLKDGIELGNDGRSKEAIARSEKAMRLLDATLNGLGHFPLSSEG